MERVKSFLNDTPGEQWERDSALISQLWFNAAHFRMAEEQAAGSGKSYLCSVRIFLRTEKHMSGNFMTQRKKK